MHGEHTREDTLVVTVQQSTQAGETRDTKNPRVLDQSSRPRRSGKRLATSQGRSLKRRTSSNGSHVVENLLSAKEEKKNDQEEGSRFPGSFYTQRCTTPFKNPWKRKDQDMQSKPLDLYSSLAPNIAKDDPDIDTES